MPSVVFARFLREDCIEIKNKEWNAGEKPEEKSLRSTLTYFKGDYCLKKDNDCTIKCGGTPVILVVRHHGIITSLAHRRN